MHAGSFSNRFIALALLAFLVLAVLQLMVAPMLTAYREVARTIELSQGLLDRYRAMSAGGVQLAARLAAVEKTATRAVPYIIQSTDALAGAALQNHVQNVVKRANGELHSSEILPVESVQLEISVRRVALKLKLLVEIGGLQGLIYDLETAQPFVFIRELSILGITEARHRSDAGTKPMLEVRLQVYGFMRAPSTMKGPTALQEVPRLATESNSWLKKSDPRDLSHRRWERRTPLGRHAAVQDTLLVGSHEVPTAPGTWTPSLPLG